MLNSAADIASLPSRLAGCTCPRLAHRDAGRRAGPRRVGETLSVSGPLHACLRAGLDIADNREPTHLSQPALTHSRRPTPLPKAFTPLPLGDWAISTGRLRPGHLDPPCGRQVHSPRIGDSSPLLLLHSHAIHLGSSRRLPRHRHKALARDPTRQFFAALRRPYERTRKCHPIRRHISRGGRPDPKALQPRG